MIRNKPKQTGTALDKVPIDRIKQSKCIASVKKKTDISGYRTFWEPDLSRCLTQRLVGTWQEQTNTSLDDYPRVKTRRWMIQNRHRVRWIPGSLREMSSGTRKKASYGIAARLEHCPYNRLCCCWDHQHDNDDNGDVRTPVFRSFLRKQDKHRGKIPSLMCTRRSECKTSSRQK